MAILFDDGSTEYLQYGGAVVAGYPLTMACWFYADVLTLELAMMQLADASQGDEWFSLELRGQDPGDPVAAWARTTGSSGERAATSTTPTVNTWHHACGVFTNATGRAVFLDGGGKGTNTVDVTPQDIDRTCIGRYGDSSPGQYWSGRLAEVAIWSVALSDVEVALLAKGYSPLFFQPEDLAGYWPLISLSDLQDRIGDANMTATNAPLTAVHPPKIIYPTPPYVGFGAAAAPPAGNPYYAYAQQ